MKYVCFDIGNVLCHVSFEKLLGALSKILNISQGDALYFLNRTQKLHDLGLTNLRDELRDHFKIHSEIIIQELLTHWNEVIWEEFLMTDLLNELTNEGVNIALLSNIGLEHTAHLNKIWSKSNLGFEKSIHFFSCEVGARKPSILYYQSFLLLHPEFKGCIYIDDMQDNLNVAKNFGFKTIKFDLDEFISKDKPMPYGLGAGKIKLKSRVSELKKLILETE